MELVVKRPYASFLNAEFKSEIDKLVDVKDVEQLELIYSEFEHRSNPKAIVLMA